MKNKKRKAAKQTVTRKKKQVKTKRLAPVKKAVVVKTVHPGWVALELTQRGETEKNINSLLDLIRKNLNSPALEIFVPIYYENEEFFEKKVALMTGYFFIKYDPTLSFHKLKNSKFFEGVVCNPVTNAVNIIPESQIQELKAKFNKIINDASNVRVGQTVEILDGLYKSLTGVVSRVIKKDELCIIKVTCLRSRNITVSAPFMSVKIIDDGEDNSDVVKFF